MLSQLIMAELRDPRPNKLLAQQPRSFASSTDHTLVCGSKQSRKPKPYDSDYNKTKAAISSLSADAHRRNAKVAPATDNPKIQLKLKADSDPCAVSTFATSLYPPYTTRKSHHRFCSSQLSPAAVLAIQGRALFNLVSLLKSSPDLMMIYRRQERSRMAASCYVNREVLGNNAESVAFGGTGTVGIGGAIKGKKGSIIGAVMGTEPAQLKMKGVIATKGEIRSIKNGKGITYSKSDPSPAEVTSVTAPWATNGEDTTQTMGDLSYETDLAEHPKVQEQEEENAMKQAAEVDILSRLYEPPEFRLYASREVDRTSFTALQKIYLPKRKKPKTWFRETERFATKSVAYAGANAKSELPEYQEYAPLVDCCIPRRFIPSQRNYARFAHLRCSSPLRLYSYNLDDVDTDNVLEELRGDIRSKLKAGRSEVDPEDEDHENRPVEIHHARSTEVASKTSRKTRFFKGGDLSSVASDCNDFETWQNEPTAVAKNVGDKWTTMFHHALTSLSHDIKEIDGMPRERGKYGNSDKLRAEQIKKTCSTPFKSKARKNAAIHFSDKAITVEPGDEQHLPRTTVCRSMDIYQNMSIPCTSVTEATVTTSTCSSVDEVSLLANIVQNTSGTFHTPSEQHVVSFQRTETSTKNGVRAIPLQNLQDGRQNGGEITAHRDVKELMEYQDEETETALSTSADNALRLKNSSPGYFVGFDGRGSCSSQYHTNGTSAAFGDGCIKASMRFSLREGAISLPTSPSRSPAVSKISRRTVSSSSHQKHIDYLPDDVFENHGKEFRSKSNNHAQFRAICNGNHQRKHNKFWQAFQWLGFW